MRRAAMLIAPLVASSAIAAGPTTAAIDIRLAPRPAAPGGRDIAAIDVDLRFAGVAAGAGAPLLRLPLVISNVDSVATVLTGVEARDAAGPLPLSARDVALPVEAARDAEAGGPTREWIAGRATIGAIAVHYAVPAQASLPPRGPAPPFAFSNDGEGMSAMGGLFLLLPPGRTAYRTHVAWDLAALPKGARGLTSYGEGAVTAPGRLTAAGLRMAYYMAGRIGTWPATPPASGFFAAWQGKPPFDAPALMRWTGTLYGRYARFFGQRRPPPYGVFLRYNPINAGGGVGLDHAFVTTFGRAGGNGSDVGELRSTLAHEMFHTFQPFIERPAGLASSWFGEGLATFYQRRLPLRFGQITPAAFLADLNFHAARYYTSAMAAAPNDEVPKRFWADTRIRTLPYDRGMLYFASVDDALRKHSAGKRSLDDLMLAMLAKQRAGASLANSDWEALLRADVGPAAVDEFRAFLAGKPPLPASDAFGPCFERVSRSLRRYDLGFDTAVLAEPKRIVRGLVPGSAAAAAGLRDGDEILVPVPQDHIQGDQSQRLVLSVRRGERTIVIDYLPRGETTTASLWARKPGVPDSRCAL